MLGLGVGATGVSAQARTPLRLSFAEAVARAAGTTPTVELAGLRTSEAEARVREARGALLPSFGISAAWVNRSFNKHSLGIEFPPFGTFVLPERIGPFNNYDARLTATQTLFDLSSAARVRAARAQAEGSSADQRVVVEGAAQNAALAYLRAARAGALADARRADSTIAAELVRLAEAQKSAGVSAAIDVTRARTQLAVAAAQLIVARTETERTRIGLARAMGLDAATPLELSDTLSPAIATIDVPADRDAVVERALSGRPDLRAEVARGVAARQATAAISAERLPRLSLEADYGVNGLTVPSALSTGQLALALNIPLLDGFRREGRHAEQDAIARESSVRERDLRQQIAADVDDALLELHSAAAQQQIAAERLQLAREELADARERFAAGVAGNIEVINAQATLIQARDADIDTRFGAATARVALARAIGAAQTLH
jgi:outer membrane protein